MNRHEKSTVIETLAALVRINSVNPNYEGGVDELELAESVENFFSDRGIETWHQNVFPNRPNVMARIPGVDPNRRIVLEAHLDTVSVKGMTIDPWNPVIRDGKLYGRGACDTKGGMAAMMHALANIAADGIAPPCEVLFAATIDEEFSFRGVLALCEPPFHANAAIIAEPTDLQLVIASKGLVRWKIETFGKPAHSAKPHLGINAIEHMAQVITAIQRDTVELSRQSHPLLGPATCNIGVVRGGVQINFVPDRCEIEIDRRMLPGETVDSVLCHYQEIVDSVTADNPSMQVVMHPPMLTDRPLETEASEPAVQVMVRVLEQCALDGTMIVVPVCCYASKFGGVGIPSMILGPGSINQAHSSVEFIECEQVTQAAEIYRRFILSFS